MDSGTLLHVYAPIFMKSCTTLILEGKPVGTPDALRIISEHKVKSFHWFSVVFRKEDPNGNFKNMTYLNLTLSLAREKELIKNTYKYRAESLLKFL